MRGIHLIVAGMLALVMLASSPSLSSAESFAGHAGDTPSARKGRWIEVIIAEQRLVAWENGRAVMTTPVSTGTRYTPTPRGTFRIYRKYVRQHMRGQDYSLPNVPYVMYFKQGGYAIHGTYWHANFGRPASHGCVNLPTSAAAWLYRWAPRGTVVVIR